jgi:hypothetical protein
MVDVNGKLMRMDTSFYENRWRIGLLITPTRFSGFPQRTPLFFGTEATAALEHLQESLAKVNCAGVNKYGEDFPRLLIDHYGFQLDPGLGVRKVRDSSGANLVLGSNASDLICLVSAAIPPAPPKKSLKVRRKKQASKGLKP